MIVKWVIFPVALIFMVYGEQLKSMQFFFEEDNENERLQYKTRDSAFNKLL